MSQHKCPRCAAAEPKAGRLCAFKLADKQQPVFTPNNWNCATANAIRDIAERHAVVCCEDQRAVLLPAYNLTTGWFVLVSWYKNRGQTDAILRMSSVDETELDPITLIDAERIIATYEKHHTQN